MPCDSNYSEFSVKKKKKTRHFSGNVDITVFDNIAKAQLLKKQSLGSYL